MQPSEIQKIEGIETDPQNQIMEKEEDEDKGVFEFPFSPNQIKITAQTSVMQYLDGFLKNKNYEQQI